MFLELKSRVKLYGDDLAVDLDSVDQGILEQNGAYVGEQIVVNELVAILVISKYLKRVGSVQKTALGVSGLAGDEQIEQTQVVLLVVVIFRPVADLALDAGVCEVHAALDDVEQQLATVLLVLARRVQVPFEPLLAVNPFSKSLLEK